VALGLNVNVTWYWGMARVGINWEGSLDKIGESLLPEIAELILVSWKWPDISRPLQKTVHRRGA
jgi:hypothetical protein